MTNLGFKGYSLVIFDMDGLMLDTEKLAFATFRDATFEVSGCRVDEEMFAHTLGANVEESRRIYRARFGQDFPFDEMLRRRRALASAHFEQHGVPLKDGLVELLQTLTELGWKRAVATSSSRVTAEGLLRRAGVWDCFDFVQCGDEVTCSKPHPEIFERVAAALGCAPEDCLVLEDSPRGVEAAHRAGMDVIMVPDLLAPTEAERARTRAIVDSLADVRDLFLADAYTNAKTGGNTSATTSAQAPITAR